MVRCAISVDANTRDQPSTTVRTRGHDTCQMTKRKLERVEGGGTAQCRVVVLELHHHAHRHEAAQRLRLGESTYLCVAEYEVVLQSHVPSPA
jgi:predicted amidophosphoribosyltransferase